MLRSIQFQQRSWHEPAGTSAYGSIPEVNRAIADITDGRSAVRGIAEVAGVGRAV